MELAEAIMNRRSIRKYLDKDVLMNLLLRRLSWPVGHQAVVIFSRGNSLLSRIER
jgi:hypothetical protein